MDKSISNNLKTIFLVHAIVGLVFGAALWLVPGRFLSLVGWVDAQVVLPESNLSIPGTTFVDAYITRMVGAALLALAFSSFLGWRASRWDEVAIVVKLETVFCLLGLIGIFVSMALGDRPMPAFGWVEVLILAAFAIAWALAWQSHTAS